MQPMRQRNEGGKWNTEGGCFEVKHAFGYFSSKDGQVYHFDLCEQCFDKMLAEFRVPAEVKEARELL